MQLGAIACRSLRHEQDAHADADHSPATHTDEFYELVTKARLTDPKLDWQLMAPASEMMPKWAEVVMHTLP